MAKPLIWQNEAPCQHGKGPYRETEKNAFAEVKIGNKYYYLH